MDFNFTDEQLAFRDTARQFADKELAPFAAEWDQHGTFPKDTIRRAGELGLGAIVRHGARSRRGRVERATRARGQCARGKARLGTGKKKRRRTFLSSTSPLGRAHF